MIITIILTISMSVFWELTLCTLPSFLPREDCEKVARIFYICTLLLLVMLFIYFYHVYYHFEIIISLCTLSCSGCAYL